MNSIRKVTLGFSIAVLCAGIAAFTAFAVMWEPSWGQKIEGLASFPTNLSPAGDGSGELTLYNNGAAELEKTPVGTVETSSGSPCLNWDGKRTFTGPARWTADEDLLLTLTTPMGDTVIGPYRPPFSGVVWYRFGMPRCGNSETLWYWSNSED